MEYLTTAYWKATEYNELDNWNKECLPKINNFWNDVLKYRKRPIEEIKELLMPSKNLINNNNSIKEKEKVLI